jgi:hypothetical protein
MPFFALGTGITLNRMHFSLLLAVHLTSPLGLFERAVNPHGFLRGELVLSERKAQWHTSASSSFPSKLVTPFSKKSFFIHPGQWP